MDDINSRQKHFNKSLEDYYTLNVSKQNPGMDMQSTFIETRSKRDGLNSRFTEFHPLPNYGGLSSYPHGENSRNVNENNNIKEELNDRFTRFTPMPSTTSIPFKYEMKQPLDNSISNTGFSRENYNDKISQLNMMPKNTSFPINNEISHPEYFRSTYDINRKNDLNTRFQQFDPLPKNIVKSDNDVNQLNDKLLIPVDTRQTFKFT